MPQWPTDGKPPVTTAVQRAKRADLKRRKNEKAPTKWRPFLSDRKWRLLKEAALNKYGSVSSGVGNGDKMAVSALNQNGGRQKVNWAVKMALRGRRVVAGKPPGEMADPERSGTDRKWRRSSAADGRLKQLTATIAKTITGSPTPEAF